MQLCDKLFTFHNVSFYSFIIVFMVFFIVDMYLEFVHHFSTLFTLFRGYNLQKVFTFDFLHANVFFNRCFCFFLKFHVYVFLAQNLIFTNWWIGLVRPDQPEGGAK